MKKKNDHLSFGKRYGYEPVEIPFQIDNIDKILRNDLWNAFYIYIYIPLRDAEFYDKESFKMLHRILWIHFLKNPLDDFPGSLSEIRSVSRNYIENEIWYKVYEFFEFIFINIINEQIYQYEKFASYVNDILKNNNSGYTLINNRFIPVINNTEIDEIRKTQSISIQFNLKGIQEHLNSSLELISKKPTPDYRNSIKESISMVEVISRIIEPAENTLGKALNKLEKKQKLNVNLKSGFEKLYNYTNGKNGIRHALMEEKNLTSEDAKFFLVVCSAFTNYLIEKAQKEKLLKN